MQDRMKDLRIDNDLSQKELGRILGITQRKYSYIERGIQEPAKEILIVMADLYRVNIDYLLGRTDEKAPLPKSRRPEL